MTTFTKNPFTGALDAVGSSSSSGMAIGSAITSGTEPAILYVDTGSVLGQDPDYFGYADATKVFTLGKSSDTSTSTTHASIYGAWGSGVGKGPLDFVNLSAFSTINKIVENYMLKNSAATDKTFAAVRVGCPTITSTAEDGSYELRVMNAGSFSAAFLLNAATDTASFLAPYEVIALSGLLTSGVASTTTGQLSLFNATNAFTTIIKSGIAAASVTYTLPTNAPAVTGYVLSATTAGVMSWAAGGGGGSLTIGDHVTSSNPGSILFTDGSGNLADYGGFAFDPSGQILTLDATIVPVNDDAWDIGAASFQFKDLYLGGNIILSGGDVFLNPSLYAPGSVLYIGGDGQLFDDPTVFVYDQANVRLGVGIGAPEVTLHVYDKIQFGGIILDHGNDQTFIIKGTVYDNALGVAFQLSDDTFVGFFGARTTNAFFSKPTAVPFRIENVEDNTLGGFQVGSIYVDSATANGFSYFDTAKLIASTSATTNGQLLIGSTSFGPQLGSLTGTANQVVVTNGSGTITLSLPQSIATSSSPTFANITDSGLTAGRVVFAGTAGLLSNDSDLTFVTDTLTSTKIATTSLAILEGGTTPTKYSFFVGGDQSADITYTLPTAVAGGNAYVLSSTTGGVLSWAAPVAGVNRTLFTHFATAGNVSNTETDLYSDTLPANTFVANGDMIFTRYFGSTGGGTPTKACAVYFGGTQIYSNISLGTTNFDIDVLVIRDTSSSVRCKITIGSIAGVSSTYATVGSLTFSGTLIIKITGTSTGSGFANNDIVVQGGTGRLQPAP